MKNLISKKLALLAIVFFASIGHAFGQSITFDFNGINENDYNADALIVNTGSWVSSNETINFSEGEDVTIEVYAYNIYELDKVYVDGEEIAIEDNFAKQVFESISGNHTVNVVCKKLPTNTVALSFNYQDVARLCFNGSNFSRCPQGNESFEVPTGSNLRLQLEPYTNAYPVSSVKVDGNDVTTAFLAGNYSLTNIASNHTVAVTFGKMASHTISVSIPEHTKQFYFVDVESGTNFGWRYPIELAAGKDVRLYYEPATGYQVDKAFIEKGGGSIVNVANALNTNGYYEFKSLDADYEVSITTKIATQHTITIDFDNEKAGVYLNNYRSDPDHSISTYYGVEPNNTYEFNEGTTVRMTFWNHDWIYTLESIKINGEDATPLYDDNIGYYYDFNNLSADYSVVLNYEEMPSVTVNFDSDMGYVTLQEGENNYWLSTNWMDWFPSGTTMRITPKAYDGYKVGSVTVNGSAVSLTDGYYEFTLTESYNIEVNYVEAERYTITVTGDSEHGSYSLDESNPTEGSDVQLFVYPDDGYVAIVKEGGNELPTTFIPSCSTGSYTYQFTNIQASHEVEVIFSNIGKSEVSFAFNSAQIESVEINDCWGVSPSSIKDVTTGTVANLKIIPRIGYEVESAKVGNTPLAVSLTEDGYYYCEFDVVSDCTATITMKKKTAPTNVTFTLPASGEGTYCSEYDLNFRSVSGIKAYVASGFNPSTNQLVLTRVDEAPAGTGMLIKGTSGNYTIPTTNSNFLFANMLKGVVKETYISDVSWYEGWNGYDLYANYIFGTDGEFYKTTGEMLPANSAYLMIPSRYVENNSLAKISTIFLDDEEEMNGIATGIGFIKAGEPKTITTNDDVYNLQGQKVNSKTLKPGIYIKNGKKFMVK